MTVAAKTPSSSHIEDGVSKNFTLDFRFLDVSDVRAVRIFADGSTVDLVAGIDFTVAGGETDAGGTLTVAVTAAAGTRLRAWRVTPLDQQAKYPTSGTFPAQSHEEALDKLSMTTQELSRDIDRAFKVPMGGEGLEVANVDDGQVLALVDGKIQGVANDPAFAEDAAQRAAIARAEAQLARDGAFAAKEGAEAAEAASELNADRAASAAISSQGYFPGARTYVPRGAATGALAIGAAGTGGTNGTFDLAFTGGNFTVNPSGTFTVAGGVVTAITITGPGLYVGNGLAAPALSFAASAGLTGAAAALTTRYLKGAGEYYLTESSAGEDYVALFQNVGNVATLIDDKLDWASAGAARGYSEVAEAAADEVSQYLTNYPAAVIPGYPDFNVAGAELFENGQIASFTTTDGVQYLMVNGSPERVQTDVDPNDKVVFIPGFAGTAVKVTVFTDGRISSVIDDRGRRWWYGDDGWTYGVATASGSKHFDAVIYGSNTGGLTATARLKLQGKSVCVLEPYPAFGGMHACGLGMVDRPTNLQGGVDSVNCIGGLTRSLYFQRVADIVGTADVELKYQAAAHVYEQVAQNILIDYADLALKDVQIDGPRSLRVDIDGLTGDKITRGVFMRDGYISGDVFIDCSYEMDLGAAKLGPAGYRVGRESFAETGEPWAGVSPRHVFDKTSTDYRYYSGSGSALDFASIPTDLPVLLDDPLATAGQADGNYQAYNFRLNLTRDPSIYVPFEKPEGYDYRYCLPFFERIVQRINLPTSDGAHMEATMGRNNDSFGFRYPMFTAGGVTNRSQFNELDLLNFQRGYATANWPKRMTMLLNSVFMFKSLLWFMAFDPMAREYGLAGLQDDLNDVTRPEGFAYQGPIGLCGDEFQSSRFGAGFSYYMYVREALRLEAQYVMSYFDQATVGMGGTPTKAHSIGKWGYSWDMHPLLRQWIRNLSTGLNYNDRIAVEGPWAGQEVKTALYQMPMEMMWPALSLKSRNLIVPVCAGNTHLAWAPDRLEPNYGIRGEAAGENAAWYLDNIDSGLAVHDHPYADLAARLLARGSIL
ncbi:FAD-dependent oxidoreductase [Novosphingobium guangzhouense]|uniref:Uncharacterized protein n=1 Tax=Novosphingobium guangzhouense TaxID=1850347 RepID=A0A2K2G454_9SPHN|nr:FAD-dependent oxidoreductase [Novosphingobium guangzhouense]PNU05801.1 hypothetical protein A8V01_14645 [Novosphingobium guangzhouense]